MQANGFIVAAMDKSPYELLKISISVLVGLYTEKMDMHMRLIVNDPDSILNSLTLEIKEVDPDGKEPCNTPILLHFTVAIAESLKVFGNEDCPVKMKFVAPPLYALTTQTLDKCLFGGWRKPEAKHETHKILLPPRSSLCVEEKVSDLLGDSPPRNRLGRHSVYIAAKGDELRRGRDTRKPSLSSKSSHRRKESHYFPVNVANPVVPTIRVLVTFTEFEELQPLGEFSTPPLSPRSAGNESPAVMQATGSSRLHWIKATMNC
ncbi:hypothetical protein IFM89_010312 [Coptis chinensis]|uniref:Ankyrin repeat domain-containing protein n=1 Tax=Coptis chinensis TaxID=261450 RepID=A0A835HS61_9MAGN|nr:hypothetical protein IFM89_010312 [Coptis chinensis]